MRLTVFPIAASLAGAARVTGCTWVKIADEAREGKGRYRAYDCE